MREGIGCRREIERRGRGSWEKGGCGREARRRWDRERSRAAVSLAALGEIERERFAGPRVRWGVGCGWK